MNRQDLLDALAELSAAAPEMRFGQLIVNLAYLAKEPSNSAAWDVEDAELLAAAKELLGNLRQLPSTVTR